MLNPEHRLYSIPITFLAQVVQQAPEKVRGYYENHATLNALTKAGTVSVPVALTYVRRYRRVRKRRIKVRIPLASILQARINAASQGLTDEKYYNQACQYVVNLIRGSDLLLHTMPVVTKDRGRQKLLRRFDSELWNSLKIIAKGCRCSPSDVLAWCLHLFWENHRT